MEDISTELKKGNKEIMDKILKTSICFRIDIEKAETLIQELEALKINLGSKTLEETYPTLAPLQEWLEVLLNDFKQEHEDEYLKLKAERQNWEAWVSEVIATHKTGLDVLRPYVKKD